MSNELRHYARLPEITFYPRKHLGGYQAVVEYPNGYGASIVGGGLGTYGDGVNTFELAITHGPKLCYATPITGDVMGWLSITDLAGILKEISELPPNPECVHQRPDDDD